jgi:hypothetical protein
MWQYHELALLSADGGTRNVSLLTEWLYLHGGRPAAVLPFFVLGGLYVWAVAGYLQRKRELEAAEGAEGGTSESEREREDDGTAGDQDERAAERQDGDATGKRGRGKRKRWRRERVLPSPPRLDGDPFRSPPHKPLIVQHATPEPAAPPIVPGDPADKPKLLG